MRLSVEREGAELLDRPANSYLVEVDGITIVVDGGVEGRLLGRADAVLLTHWHWDHVLGIARSGYRGPVCASKRTLDYLTGRYPAMEGARAISNAFSVMPAGVALIAKRLLAIVDEVRDFFKYRADARDLDECDVIRNGLVEYLECPGHSDDHTCYKVEDVVFVGDHANPGSGLSILSLTSYVRSSLELLSDGGWRVAMPGHGDPLSRSELASYMEAQVRSKVRRVAELYRLLSKEWQPLENLLPKLYEGASLDSLLAYVSARSLLGYALTLVELGLAELNSDRSPWTIRALK